MKKVILALALMSVVLVANQDHPTLAPVGVCTGGACFVDSIRSNSIFNNQSKFGPEGNYNQQKPAPVTTDGLSDRPNVYDPNCQFGTCINPSAGGNYP